MLTLSDLANPNNPSGYNHVGKLHSGWRATVYDAARSRHKSGLAWWGPLRAEPRQAAQDYLDHVNGRPVVSGMPARRVVRQGRRAVAGRPDVLRIGDDVFVDLPPDNGGEVNLGTVVRVSRERNFMLTDRFQAAVKALPPGARAEVTVPVGLHALAEEYGELVLKAIDDGVPDAPKFIICEAHPQQRWVNILKGLGVEVIVP